MRKATFTALLMLACNFAFAQDDALQQRLEELQNELEALREQVEEAAAAKEDKDGRQKAVASDEYLITYGQAWNPKEGRTSVGGYGEINYNNFSDASKRDEFDVQRVILFIGHRFSDRTRLYSEIEFEHGITKGGDSSSGEVAMEQAYIEQMLTDTGGANLRAGLQLLPMGFINEFHEPPVFYGVERNEVETRIIPSTWREIGFALQGYLPQGFEYNTGFTTTPDASLFKDASSGFKDMRTKGNRVTANEFGYYAALRYRGVLGLTLGGGVWSGNTAQNGQGKGANASALTGFDANLTIWDLHARYQARGWDLRALYTQGGFSDTVAINNAAGLALGSNDAAPEKFFGWLLEGAYRFKLKNDMVAAPFVRYEEYNTQKEVAAGYTKDPLNDEQVTTVGLNFYVHPQVVFKIDTQDYSTDNKKDRWNVGIGWMF